jgi:hypothetical protein
MAHQLNSALARLIFEVSRSHAIIHAHPVGLWVSDQLVAAAATYTTHNKYRRRTSMPSAGFEPAIPAIDRPQTHALPQYHRRRQAYVLSINSPGSIFFSLFPTEQRDWAGCNSAWYSGAPEFKYRSVDQLPWYSWFSSFQANTGRAP